jgi:hypothetical protein
MRVVRSFRLNAPESTLANVSARAIQELADPSGDKDEEIVET